MIPGKRTAQQAAIKAAPLVAKHAQPRRGISGQCSFEQPISDKPCLKCGFKCTPKGTAHWEGGAGSRNVGALSNKESKKFKGGQKGDTAKHKTASKKSSRVGAAAKQARAAKQSAKQG